jgi:hypothetical protein
LNFWLGFLAGISGIVGFGGDALGNGLWSALWSAMARVVTTVFTMIPVSSSESADALDRRRLNPLLRSSLVCFTTSAVMIAIAIGLVITGEHINRTSTSPRNPDVACGLGPGFGVQLAGLGVGMLSVPPGLIGTVYLLSYGVTKAVEVTQRPKCLAEPNLANGLDPSNE